MCASFQGSCTGTCGAGSLRAIHSRTFLASSVEPAIEIFCDIYFLGISELVVGLAGASPVDAVVVVFGFGLIFLQEDFNMILRHDCILDLRCVLGRDTFSINDEQGPALRVRGNELFVIGYDDSVAGLFAFAGCVHVAIHLGFRWKGFFAVVIILVGSEPFQVG